VSQIYADADQFEDLFRRLFAQIETDDPHGMDPLVKAKMVICFAVREPEAEMWVDGRTAPVTVTFGPSDLRATLTAQLTGETLHELLLGTLPLGKSLSSRRLKVKGSKLKALKLESLLHACQAGYPALADELLG
jgi:hypothetical protein